MKFEDITPAALKCFFGHCQSVHRSLTPADLECTMDSCPSLHEVTPECSMGGCPSVHEIASAASKELLIVGKVVPPEFYADTPGCNPGEGEQAIVIDERYFEKWLEEKIAAYIRARSADFAASELRGSL